MTGRLWDDGEALIFQHIPKTAGTTMSQILLRQYPPEDTFRIERARQTFAELSALTDEQRAQIRLLYGHLLFGAHELLPRTARYLTFLRDPVDRAMSHYYSVLRTPDHRLYSKVTSRRMSLADYVESGISRELANGQTCLIAGGELGREDLCSPELLERAKRNIGKHFWFVGLTERFNESLLLVKEIFGWKEPVYYTPLNVTSERPPLRDMSKDAVNLIREHNRLDLALYQFAEERLDVEIERRGSDFQRRLRIFRLVNAGIGLIPLRVRVALDARRRFSVLTRTMLTVVGRHRPSG
jgi:hypothetical protein